MKSIIKKTILSGLLAAGLAMQACGNGEPARMQLSEVDLETLDPSGQQVVFWYQHTRERQEELLALIAEFNRTNSYRITVRGEYAGNYNDIYNKMIVGLQGGMVPHLVVAYQNQAQAYYQAQGVVDLSPYMASDRWGLTPQVRADFFEAFLEQDKVDGVQICFPSNRSMEVLYYNRDWLRELGHDGPPRTWDAFADLCRQARAQPFTRSIDKRRSLGFLVDVDASRMASLVFSMGGDLVNSTHTAYTLDAPEVRRALNMLQELIREGVVGMVGEQGGDQREFSVGQVLFALRSSSGLPFFESAIEEGGVGFDWDVTHPPSDDRPPVVNVYGASVSVCRTTPEAQLAAWLFLKWFTEPEQQARWVRASNYFPVRKSAALELEEYFAQNRQYKSAYDLLEYGTSEPSIANYQQVRRLIQNAMVDILEGGDVDRVLQQLNRAANRTLVDG